MKSKNSAIYIWFFGILVIVLTTFHSCRKDEQDQTLITDLQSQGIKVDVFGIVTDQSGVPLPGVKVAIGNVMAFTNEDGFYVLKNGTTVDDRYYVSAEKATYFTSGKGGRILKTGAYSANIRLFNKGNPVQLDAATGGVVNTTDGGTIGFPSHAFITASGQVYTGTVFIYKRQLLTDAGEFESKFPGGDLAGVNASGKRVSMSPFGFLGVELEDQTGNKLQLANGKSASIRIPVVSSQLSTAPLQTSLMWFDEKTGYWKEDATAVKNGNFYEGSVSHFTWWSVSVITNPPAPTIQGQVVDCNNVPVPYITVVVDGLYSLITDAAGQYTSWIPPGQHAVFSSQTNNFGLFVSNTEYINISTGNSVVPDLVTPCPATLTFQAKDCFGNNTAAFACLRKLNAGSGSFLINSMAVQFSGNGFFTFPVPNNQSIVITLTDGLTWVRDTVITSVAGSQNSAGNIVLCNSAIQACPGGPSTVTDVDGNLYHVVSIGNQCWLKENLRVTKYSNGDTIGLAVSPNSGPYGGSYPVYPYGTYVTSSFSAVDSTFGKYYNVITVNDPRDVCPTGWHVATMHDYRVMIKNLDFLADTSAMLMSYTAGGMLKSTLMGSSTNSSGFTALPGGMVEMNNWGLHYIYDKCYLLSGDSLLPGVLNLNGIYMDYHSPRISSTPIGNDYAPVRCIRD